MHKRILAIVTLLCAIPLLAFAAGTGLQQINTWVQSPGGSLKVDSYPAATSATGSQFLSYSSSTSTNTVFITPNTNYFVNSLIFNGVPQSTSSIATIVASGLPVTAGDSVWVSFLRNQLTFTVNGGSGYIVFPSGVQPNVYSGATYRVFEFIPAKGQFIASINPSSSVNMTYTTSTTLPAAVNQKVIVTVSSITGSATLSATVGGTAVAPAPGLNSDGTTMTKAQAARACDACHIAQGLDPNGTAILAPYSSGAHKNSQWDVVLCATCHQGAGTGAHPGVPECSGCHTPQYTPHDLIGATSNPLTPTMCANCHTADGNIHNVTNPPATPTSGIADSTASCQACHNVAQTAMTGKVSDNNGVRAITTEFSKWSHHVTGVTLQDAHCAACHLEGKASNGQIVVDHTLHMSGNVIHLRNCATDADLQWTPDTPNFGTMDTFCMSCHNANGAISAESKAIQALIVPATGKVASATNPFGDTISNQYDKMSRSAVVDVSAQFATTNPSHHAVMGQRYSGRTRVGSTRTINSTTFTANSSATLQGPRRTIYDAGKFNSTYLTLSPAPSTTDQTLGDDSVLHCADCHTVGQYAARGSVAFGVMSSAYATGGITNFYKTAIGAHGSQNEYMLRNSIGSDARHQGIEMDSAGAAHLDTVTPYLVCYNCHIIAATPASTFMVNVNGTLTSVASSYGTSAHIGEQVLGEANCNTPNQTNSVNTIGTARLTSEDTMTAGTFVIGAPEGATYSNIYGIQCSNCHNSGYTAGNIFGGIHGAADPTYTDGAGNTTKHERFLPGLGNVQYVPGTRGGFTGGSLAYVNYSTKPSNLTNSKGAHKGSYSYTTGGVTNDANWEEAQYNYAGDNGTYGNVAPWSHAPGAQGCYTLSNGPVASNDESDGVLASAPATSAGLSAPAADGGAALLGNWGGCTFHAGEQAAANHHVTKKTSVRPVTY